MAEEVMGELIVWSNGMVMCFNTNGRQMPAFQGEVYHKLRLALDRAEADGAACYVGDWHKGKEVTTIGWLRTWLFNVKGE